MLCLQKRGEVYNNVKRAEAASTVLSFFHRQSQEQNCCMLCKRDFHSEEELGECDIQLSSQHAHNLLDIAQPIVSSYLAKILHVSIA